MINVRSESEPSCVCKQGWVAWKWDCYPRVLLGAKIFISTRNGNRKFQIILTNNFRVSIIDIDLD